MAAGRSLYDVSVSWRGGRDGSGALDLRAGSEEVVLAVPPAFQGPGGGANPEKLLTGAVAACYAMTYGIIAANRRIPLADLSVEATGEVEHQGATHVYRRVVIRPRIEVAATATPEQRALAREMVEKAAQYCVITSAIRGRVEVEIEPDLVDSRTPG